MRQFIGILLIIAGFVIALYVGIYLMFIGGIVELIQTIKANNLNSAALTWAIIKIYVARFIGALIGIIIITIGWFIWNSG